MIKKLIEIIRKILRYVLLVYLPLGFSYIALNRPGAEFHLEFVFWGAITYLIIGNIILENNTTIKKVIFNLKNIILIIVSGFMLFGYDINKFSSYSSFVVYLILVLYWAYLDER